LVRVKNIKISDKNKSIYARMQIFYLGDNVSKIVIRKGQLLRDEDGYESVRLIYPRSLLAPEQIKSFHEGKCPFALFFQLGESILLQIIPSGLTKAEIEDQKYQWGQDALNKLGAMLKITPAVLLASDRAIKPNKVPPDAELEAKLADREGKINEIRQFITDIAIDKLKKYQGLAEKKLATVKEPGEHKVFEFTLEMIKENLETFESILEVIPLVEKAPERSE
jgi:hypothetical protein